MAQAPTTQPSKSRLSGTIRLTNPNTWEAIRLVGGLLLAAGLSLSPVLMSIGVALLGLSGLALLFVKTPAVVPKQSFIQNLSGYGISIVLPIVLYGLQLLAFFTTDNTAGWIEEVRIKLPLLLVPLAFLTPQKFNASRISWLRAAFVVPLLGVTLATLVHYLLHYAEINESFLHSKPIPIITLYSGASHIYFTLMMAFGFFVCIDAARWVKADAAPARWQRHGYSVAAVFLFVCLHIFSARTGLFALYAGLGLMGIMWVVQARRYHWALALALVVGGTLLPIAAYYTVPPLRNRVLNTIEDLSAYYKDDDLDRWSLARRIAVWQVSFDVVREYPVLGAGPADLATAIDTAFARRNYRLCPENRILNPHNQFLEYAGGTGVVGLAVFVLLLIAPFVWGGVRYRTNTLFVLFVVCSCAGFLVESTLERQVGVSFFIWYWCLLLSHYER